ncbi:hypothetical protein BKA70DRAFT_367210 [Coprinopsis sp. MPI-PUGE-AT-0042]|nr:hypothetical protein BKA70DRAFT_367210 [Coprinopsis sp. MPI-PUGE-AT-0042]
MDTAYPPPKRSRGEDYPATPRFAYSESAIHDPRQGPPPQSHTIRVIQPSEKYPHPGHPQGRHARASSHSSASSMDVDEMLLRTTEQGASNGTGPGTAPLQAQGSTIITSSHRTRTTRSQPAPRPVGEDPSQQQVFGRTVSSAAGGAYPANQSDPREFGGRKRDPLQGTAPLQQYNTHVFAPPVTGAPIKKSKYSSGNLAAQGSLDPQSQTSPQAIFPASNEQGQRICRQCGQVGRYKDGKCVEKWGPGPMGPGTVCDR